MSQFADFTSLFNIQRQYLVDLSAISLDSSYNNVDSTLALKNQLNTLFNTYNTALPASSAALDNQSQMYNIIQQEKQRLEEKKKGIDNAYATQQRLIQLNESYREKNMKYITILIILIIAISIYLALLMASRNLSFISPFVINLLTALLISGTVIIIAIIIARINKRDNMNFQKLLFVPPDNSGNVYGNIYGNVSLTGYATCIGNICCGAGTTWDSATGVCKPTTTSGTTSGTTAGFTLMNGLYGNNNCDKCNGQEVQYIPYVPFEFDSYAKI